MEIGPRADEPGESAGSQPGGVDQFWTWWIAAGAAATNAAIEAGDMASVVDILDEQVTAIGPGLAWEVGAGQGSRHRLVVSPEGNSDLRALARRWLQKAPEVDEVWSYADSRQRGDMAGSLRIGSADIKFSDMVVGALRAGNHFNVKVHHPSFADLSEYERLQATFLSLDHLLGENDVGTWIGAIEPVVHPPSEEFPLAHLAVLVDDLARENTREDGTPVWLMLEWKRADGPVLAAAQVPLRATAAPEFDTYVAVEVTYSDRTETGLPGPGSLNALWALEDRVRTRLGAAGRMVAYETAAGVRTLHVYVDSTNATRQMVEAAVSGWDQGPITVTSQPDPRWEAVAHLDA